MMKIIITLLVCVNSITLLSQNLEIFGGPNKNIFHDNETSGHYRSSYISSLGFFAGFGIETIKVDWLTMRFTLCFDKYGGELEVTDGGLGGESTTKAKIDKSVISLGLFPINFRIKKKVDLNFGLEISRLINETFSGTESGWQIAQPNWSFDLHEKYNRFSILTHFGLRARIAYDLFLSESIVISPQYSYYFGLFNEFDEFPIKSMRHYFCIGIEKKLK